MHLIATRILPILAGLAFLNFFVRIGLTVFAGDATAGYGVFGAFFLFILMLFATVVVGRAWQRKSGKTVGAAGAMGAAGMGHAALHDPSRLHDSGSGGDIGGGFGGGGDGGGGGGGA